MSCCITKAITKGLIIIGALNWGLIGFFNYNLVSVIFGGSDTTGARIVYSLVGIAGLFGLVCLVRCCCSKNSCPCGCHSGERCNGSSDESTCCKTGKCKKK
jgi:uncharacterized membrane protein YuzA (DUF378 family)